MIFKLEIVKIRSFYTLTYILIVLLSVSSCSTRKTTWSRRVFHQTTTRYNVNFNGYMSLEAGINSLESQFSDNYSEVLPIYPLEIKELIEETVNLPEANTRPNKPVLNTANFNTQNFTQALTSQNTDKQKNNNSTGYKQTQHNYQYKYTPNTSVSLNHSGGGFGRAAEKAEKAIKKHSLKRKPYKNPVKYRENPAYKTFYDQNEFNAELHKSWMLLGYAQFYQGNFMHSVGTFNFIADKYENLPEVALTALIWKARAYTELGWYYEADDALKLVNSYEFPESLNNLYAKNLSHLLLQEKKYSEAIPSLIETINTEKVKKNKHRYIFILAQIYQILGERDKAFDTYTDLLKRVPQYDLAIHTRIKRTEVMNTEAPEGIQKTIKRLLRKHPEDSYTYLIYHALGNIDYATGKPDDAIQHYQLSMEYNTDDNALAGHAAFNIAKIYEEKQAYRTAADFFIEAAQLLSEESSLYKEAQEKDFIYSHFAEVYDLVQQQDDKLYLATLSTQEQKEVLTQRMKENREAQKERETKGDLIKNKKKRIRESQSTGKEMKGGWYFYNQHAVEQGKKEFAQKWGAKNLSDNWFSNENAFASNVPVSASFDLEVSTTTENKQEKNTGKFQNEIEEMLLNQTLKELPNTEDKRQESNAALESALFQLAYSYQYDIKDSEKAIKTFQRIEDLFGNSNQMGSVYYALYLLGKSSQQATLENEYKNKVLNHFSDTRFGYLLTDPNYMGKIAKLEAQEDADYNSLFQTFVSDQNQSIVNRSLNYRNKYKDSEMIPQVLYMEAIAQGKLGNMDVFSNRLKNISNKYAHSDIAPLANSILTLFEKNKIAPLPSGSTMGLLSAREREVMAIQQAQRALQQSGQEPEAVIDELFTYNPYDNHYFALHVNDTTNGANELLYSSAYMNFSKFITKQFELKKVNLRGLHATVVVGEFSNNNEAQEYGKILQADSLTASILAQNNHTIYTISDKNLKVLTANKNSLEYIWFYRKYYLGIDEPRPGTKKKPVERPDIPEDLVLDTDDELDMQELESAFTKPDIELLEKLSSSTQTGGVDLPQVEFPQNIIPTLEIPANDTDEKISATETDEDLFVMEDEITHYYGIVCLSGEPDMVALKSALNRFMQENYPDQPLIITQKRNDKGINIILIGDLNNKQHAIEFLHNVVKDIAIKDALKSCEYRNTLISEKNIPILMDNISLERYGTFFKSYYLNRK